MDKETLSAIKQLLKEELSPIKSQLDGLQSQTSENTQILKALEHKVDIIKAEQENMKPDLANISGDVQSIKKDVSTISKDLTMVQAVAGKNMTDIAFLKGVR
jgi:chromosome segregation ATPase